MSTVLEAIVKNRCETTRRGYKYRPHSLDNPWKIPDDVDVDGDEDSVVDDDDL